MMNINIKAPGFGDSKEQFTRANLVAEDLGSFIDFPRNLVEKSDRHQEVFRYLLQVYA